jgi:hypothetical protein
MHRQLMHIPTHSEPCQGKVGQASCLPVRRASCPSLEFGNFSSGASGNPAGIASIQPRVAPCEASATMGHEPKRIPTLKGLKQFRGAAAKPTIQPFQGWRQFRYFTQGSSLPRNPGLNDCHPDGMAPRRLASSTTKCPNSRDGHPARRCVGDTRRDAALTGRRDACPTSSRCGAAAPAATLRGS